MYKKRKRHQKQNFGYGRTLSYAVKQALISEYGFGCYGTRKTHEGRINIFIKLLSDYDVNDVRYITAEHTEAFAQRIEFDFISGNMCLSYAHNMISSVNIIMRIFRRNDDLYIKASDYLDARTYIRKKVPSMNDQSINEAISILNESGYKRGSAIIRLVRHFGLRLREAVLMDLDRCWIEYKKTGFVTILEGTKGGRKCDSRNIPVTPEGVKALEYARKVRPEGSKNILSANKEDESLKDFLCSEVKKVRSILKRYEIVNIREIRVYFMIEYFEKVTGLSAPVVDQSTLLNEELLRLGWTEVARVAGHNRISVARSYVG
jgi:hypothetical protein